MLTRIYIDNYRCMVNFGFRPKRKQLIIGGNGTGKSAFLDALAAVRGFVIAGVDAGTAFYPATWTRWDTRPEQTFLIQALLDGSEYQYGLVIESWDAHQRVRVATETLVHDGKPLLQFSQGEVQLYNDRYEHRVTYPFDSQRSALGTIDRRPENLKLTRFKEWLGALCAVRLVPSLMTPLAEKEDAYPEQDFRNFAAWYRHISQEHMNAAASAQQALREIIPGFDSLALVSAGRTARVLQAWFASTDAPRGQRIELQFDELSDGQRTIIALYTLLNCALEPGTTLILDEPDNFLALAEIQPWLSGLTDRVDDEQSQAILISHHPELINYFAPDNASRFVRSGFGPVRVESFDAQQGSQLTPAELVARGWDHE